jgi:hypothetical protein
VNVARRDAWSAAHCHVARTLFGVCGHGGLSVVDAPTSILLTSLAGQFAWHAELLFDLLPLRDGVDREQLVHDAAEELDALSDGLRRVLASGDLATLCVVLSRLVVPRLAVAVSDEQSSTDARLEGPRARALLLIGRDLADALVRLDASSEHLLALHPTAAAPLEALRGMEAHLLGRGVVSGLLDAPPNGRSP